VLTDGDVVVAAPLLVVATLLVVAVLLVESRSLPQADASNVPTVIAAMRRIEVERMVLRCSVKTDSAG